jgi:hypothetical protein
MATFWFTQSLRKNSALKRRFVDEGQKVTPSLIF